MSFHAAVPRAASASVSLRNWSSLRHRADFLKLQKDGQKWITPAFVIQTMQHDENFSPPEIGFTTTKKIGSAVIRNRCRRRLRAMCDAVMSRYDAKGRQFVIIARSDTVTRDFQQLTKDLQWALRRLGVEGVESQDAKAG